MVADVIRPIGVTFDRTSLVYTLPFVALLCISAARMSTGELLGFVVLGAAIGAALVAKVAWYAARAFVSVDGDELVLERTNASRRQIGAREVGHVLSYSDVRGGTAGRDHWLVWLEADGATAWLTFGRQWPVDELLELAHRMNFRVDEVGEPTTVGEIRARHPEAVSWLEAHATAAWFALGAGATIVVGALYATL